MVSQDSQQSLVCSGWHLSPKLAQTDALRYCCRVALSICCLQVRCRSAKFCVICLALDSFSFFPRFALFCFTIGSAFLVVKSPVQVLLWIYTHAPLLPSRSSVASSEWTDENWFSWMKAHSRQRSSCWMAYGGMRESAREADGSGLKRCFRLLSTWRKIEIHTRVSTVRPMNEME